MLPTGEWLNQAGGLAERLTRLRRAAGLTGDRLAEQVGWPRSKVPKIENGRQMPTEKDIRDWAEACGQPGAIPELLDMLSDAQAVHRQWRRGQRGGQVALQAEFDALVRGARHIRNFETFVIPGLLQTPDYIRYRVLEAVRRGITPESEVEAVVTARRQRQEVLYDTSRTFGFTITEAALRYLLCPPQVMLGQLAQLQGFIGLEHVTLGIIPPGVELALAPMAGFLVAGDVTVLETFTAPDTYRGRESEAYAKIADDLMAEAVTGEDARRLIAAAADELRRGA